MFSIFFFLLFGLKVVFLSLMSLLACSGSAHDELELLLLAIRPIVLYARRARKPLVEELTPAAAQDSWAMLGTNLSVKLESGNWTTETKRLLCMDRKDFNRLGLGLDDLIDGVSLFLKLFFFFSAHQHLTFSTVCSNYPERGRH